MRKRYYFENFGGERNSVLEPPAASVEVGELSPENPTSTGPMPSLPQQMKARLNSLFAAKINNVWLKLQRSRSPAD
jgi:hypothetical protein